MEQVIVNGLYLGAQYALIALGLTLIFALMNVLNFAHGQMYVLGGFITYTVYGQLGLPFVVALACLRRDARGHRRADREVPLSHRSSAAACARRAPCCSPPAIAFFFDAVILLLFGEKQRGVPKIVNGVLNADGVIMPYDRIARRRPGARLHRRLHALHAVQPSPAARCGRWPRTGSPRS